MKETIKIKGMMCSGCVNTVKTALESLPGIERVEVSLENGEAVVEFDGDKIGLKEIEDKIKNAGYEIE